MKRVLPRCLVVVVPGILIGVLSAAPALADNPHMPVTADTFTLPAAGFCGDFPVRIEFPDFNQYIIRETTNLDGTITQHITGHARATATNTNTGKSVSFNISGPGTVVLYPNKTIKSGDLAGPNLLFTEQGNLPDPPVPTFPTISYTRGHVTFEVAPSGKTTSYSLAGGNRQTDVCAALAS